MVISPLALMSQKVASFAMLSDAVLAPRVSMLSLGADPIVIDTVSKAINTVTLYNHAWFPYSGPTVKQDVIHSIAYSRSDSRRVADHFVLDDGNSTIEVASCMSSTFGDMVVSTSDLNMNKDSTMSLNMNRDSASPLSLHKGSTSDLNMNTDSTHNVNMNKDFYSDLNMNKDSTPDLNMSKDSCPAHGWRPTLRHCCLQTSTPYLAKPRKRRVNGRAVQASSVPLIDCPLFNIDAQNHDDKSQLPDSAAIQASGLVPGGDCHSVAASLASGGIVPTPASKCECKCDKFPSLVCTGAPVGDSCNTIHGSESPDKHADTPSLGPSGFGLAAASLSNEVSTTSVRASYGLEVQSVPDEAAHNAKHTATNEGYATMIRCRPRKYTSFYSTASGGIVPTLDSKCDKSPSLVCAGTSVGDSCNTIKNEKSTDQHADTASIGPSGHGDNDENDEQCDSNVNGVSMPFAVASPISYANSRGRNSKNHFGNSESVAPPAAPADKFEIARKSLTGRRNQSKLSDFFMSLIDEDFEKHSVVFISDPGLRPRSLQGTAALFSGSALQNLLP